VRNALVVSSIRYRAVLPAVDSHERLVDERAEVIERLPLVDPVIRGQHLGGLTEKLPDNTPSLSNIARSGCESRP
jgi:hypothetical protein